MSDKWDGEKFVCPVCTKEIHGMSDHDSCDEIERLQSRIELLEADVRRFVFIAKRGIKAVDQFEEDTAEGSMTYSQTDRDIDRKTLAAAEDKT